MMAKGKRLAMQHLYDLEAVISTPHGARVIHRILQLSGFFKSAFHQDPAIMAALEGKRDLGLVLHQDLMEACPDKYFNLLRSSKARREKEDEDARKNHVVEGAVDDDAATAGPGPGDSR